MVKVIWSKAATKQLIRIDARYQKAIKNKVGLLADFPFVSLDTKKLTGTEAQYRLRVGDYRIRFELSGEKPKILEIQKVKRRQTNTY
ncbi:type II toxin-antitoxin system RelE/ParE family toxin [Xenorhabdus sp. M]|uniref:Type II toxin-antitoxin system RelE/ParE family toxin n=1 Tax=Xenorhabdus szentirmaii TaxID=290112 RepID=A0AAW3Z047_9GAMM|nr:type II toxin-antitoxin system RelE/ParE family toxin [Xenorhabdus sp. M]MBD2801778.1 type II toxin-antitoxin system RelE/ParE family toxin [Xenorhabdus sp. M]